MIIVFSISDNTALKEWLENRAKEKNIALNKAIREILEEYRANDDRKAG